MSNIETTNTAKAVQVALKQSKRSVATYNMNEGKRGTAKAHDIYRMCGDWLDVHIASNADYPTRYAFLRDNGVEKSSSNDFRDTIVATLEDESRKRMSSSISNWAKLIEVAHRDGIASNALGEWAKDGFTDAEGNDHTGFAAFFARAGELIPRCIENAKAKKERDAREAEAAKQAEGDTTEADTTETDDTSETSDTTEADAEEEAMEDKTPEQSVGGHSLADVTRSDIVLPSNVFPLPRLTPNKLRLVVFELDKHGDEVGREYSTELSTVIRGFLNSQRDYSPTGLFEIGEVIEVFSDAVEVTVSGIV